MSAELLKAFRLGPDLYRIGQYTPVSVRDQIVRAQYLVHALWVEGVIDATSTLAIVGAGAGGTTAAIVAAELGLTGIQLIDAADNALSLQGQATTRWLDPVQYDWPARHWSEGRWPIHDGGLMLTAQDFDFPVIRAAKSPAIAAFLQNKLAAHLGAAVMPWWQTTLLAEPRSGSGRGRLLDLKDEAGTLTTHPADVVILAMGFGRERSGLAHSTAGQPAFEGLEFWDTDGFEGPTFGMPSVPNGVLVSGSGDGALQDFVRLATGRRSVRAVVGPVLTMLPAAMARELADLWQWEESAALQRPVVPLPIDECEVLRRLHRRYQALVDAIGASPQWHAVSAFLGGVIGARPAHMIRLAVKADHFSWCYPLNRFGALLVARHLTSTSGVLPILYDTGLKSTQPVLHVCSARCWGRPHEVSLAQGAGCDASPAEVAAWPQAACTTPIFDGLVVRHGIDAAMVYGTGRLATKLAPMASPRHLP